MTIDGPQRQRGGDRRAVALEYQPREAGIGVRSEQEERDRHDSGDASGEVRRQPVDRDHSEKPRGARDDQPEGRRVVTEERQHGCDPDRQWFPRRAPEGVEVEVRDLAAPDEPGPRVVRRRRGDREQGHRERDADRYDDGEARAGGESEPGAQVPSPRGCCDGMTLTGPLTATRTSSPACHRVVPTLRLRTCSPLGNWSSTTWSWPKYDRSTTRAGIPASPTGSEPLAALIDSSSGRTTTSTAPAKARSVGKLPSSHSTTPFAAVPGNTLASPRNSATQREVGAP